MLQANTSAITKSTRVSIITLVYSDTSTTSMLICSNSVEGFIFTCQTVCIVWTSTCSAPTSTSYSRKQQGLPWLLLQLQVCLPTQFPDESEKVPSPQLSAVHTLGNAPRRVNEPLQVKQCAGLAGLEQVAQESSHPVWGIHIANYQTV